jgi:hypothetical protein
MHKNTSIFAKVWSFAHLQVRIPTFTQLKMSMSAINVSPITLITAALSLGWLAWTLCRKVSPAKRLPGIPLVEFDGDNSRERYASEAASLLVKGYDTFRTPRCHIIQMCD